MRYISIDVECAATGRGHNDRSPCNVALVDLENDINWSAVIRTPNVYHPLTDITGLTRHDISKGRAFDEVRNEMIPMLGDDVILVGQKIGSDITWMQLQRGIHYADVVDLADVFKTYNDKYRNYSYYSLSKVAYALLGKGQGKIHDPLDDATMSLQIFHDVIHQKEAKHLQAAKTKLQRMLYRKKFPSSLTPIRDFGDVCHHKFRKDLCSCGQEVDDS